MKNTIPLQTTCVNLEKYIGEPKRKKHHFKDATRRISEQQIQKLLKCKDCQEHPVLYIQVATGKKRRQVGICAKDWEGMADTVIGWNGE